MVRPRPCASREWEGAHEARDARHGARDPAARPGRAQYEGDADRAPARHRRRWRQQGGDGLVLITCWGWPARADGFAVEQGHLESITNNGEKSDLPSARRSARRWRNAGTALRRVFLPMDEALLHAAVDITGGRSGFHRDGPADARAISTRPDRGFSGLRHAESRCTLKSYGETSSHRRGGLKAVGRAPRRPRG